MNESYPGDDDVFEAEMMPANALLDFVHEKIGDALTLMKRADGFPGPNNGHFAEIVALPLDQLGLTINTYRVILARPFVLDRLPPRLQEYWELFVPATDVQEVTYEDVLSFENEYIGDEDVTETVHSFTFAGPLLVRRTTTDGTGQLELISETGVSSVVVDNPLAELEPNYEAMQRRAQEVYQELSRCNIVAVNSHD